LTALATPYLCLKFHLFTTDNGPSTTHIEH
jgi:hypothetical protein